MLLPAFALFLGAASAVPSLKHSHRKLPERQVASDVTVTAVETVFQTLYQTVEATADSGSQSSPEPTSTQVQAISSSDAATPAASSDSSDDTSDDSSSATSMGQPVSVSTTASTSLLPTQTSSHISTTSSALKTTLVTSKTSTSSASSATATAASGALPYTDIVIFGDNLSDRGNGSSDHGVAGNPETIYGFKTWTDGIIAAEVLANTLRIPIKYDYAFGHANGGSEFGATVDNNFTQSAANAPSCADQIQNYTSTGFYYNPKTVSKSLHFVWTGNNDVLPWAWPSSQSSVKVNQSHIFFGNSSDAGNEVFATQLAVLITNQARSLIKAGAEHIFVPSIYPRHVAPVVATYFNLDNSSVAQYGQVIQSANSQLKTMLGSLKTNGGRSVHYYDAFTYLMNLYNGAIATQANGIKYVDMPGKDICDGATAEAVPGTTNWDLCQVQGKGSEFYWMQFLDPTAHVHALLAADMAKAAKTAWSS